MPFCSNGFLENSYSTYSTLLIVEYCKYISILISTYILTVTYLYTISTLISIATLLIVQITISAIKD